MEFDTSRDKIQTRHVRAERSLCKPIARLNQRSSVIDALLDRPAHRQRKRTLPICSFIHITYKCTMGRASKDKRVSHIYILK